MSLPSKLVCFCFAASAWALTSAAHAYDLSTQVPNRSEQIERGFVEGQLALWSPALGTFGVYHQLSVDFGAELGFHIATLLEHQHLFVVGGLEYSPQQLDPTYFASATRSTSIAAGYAGVRLIPEQLCTPNARGCVFFEGRLGLVHESAPPSSGHRGPQAELTFWPGIGYRLAFDTLQLGVRADASLTAEYGDYTVGWLTLGGFAGAAW